MPEINTRICHKIDTLENWLASDFELLEGELAFVDGPDDNLQMIVGTGDCLVDLLNKEVKNEN
jgi:hypothetical protein